MRIIEGVVAAGMVGLVVGLGIGLVRTRRARRDAESRDEVR
jgi:hypothetical protein